MRRRASGASLRAYRSLTPPPLGCESLRTCLPGQHGAAKPLFSAVSGNRAAIPQLGSCICVLDDRGSPRIFFLALPSTGNNTALGLHPEPLRRCLNGVGPVAYPGETGGSASDEKLRLCCGASVTLTTNSPVSRLCELIRPEKPGGMICVGLHSGPLYSNSMNSCGRPRRSEPRPCHCRCSTP